MSSKKVCIWLEPDLYEFCDEARGEELSVPQYIRLILKQKKKSSAKRKPKALTNGSDPFVNSFGFTFFSFLLISCLRIIRMY